jgi:hypothetical protein
MYFSLSRSCTCSIWIQFCFTEQGIRTTELAVEIILFDQISPSETTAQSVDVLFFEMGCPTLHQMMHTAAFIELQNIQFF